VGSWQEVLGDFPAVVGGGGGGAVLGRRGFQTSTERVEVDTRGRRQGMDIVPIRRRRKHNGQVRAPTHTHHPLFTSNTPKVATKEAEANQFASAENSTALQSLVW